MEIVAFGDTVDHHHQHQHHQQQTTLVYAIATTTTINIVRARSIDRSC